MVSYEERRIRISELPSPTQPSAHDDELAADEAALRRLLAGAERMDEAAARVVVERVVPRLARFLLYRFPMLARDDAVDLTGGALTIALERRGRFMSDGRSDARTWLYGIAKRHTLEFLRKRGATVTLSEVVDQRADADDGYDFDTEPSAIETVVHRPAGGLSESVAPRSSLQQAVMNAVFDLPRQQRRAALDHYMEGMSAMDIDAQYDWKPNTAHVYLTRARRNPPAPGNTGPRTRQHDGTGCAEAGVSRVIEHQTNSDATLDELMVRAVAPLRTTAAEIELFDALHLEPISMSQAESQRLLAQMHGAITRSRGTGAVETVRPAGVRPHSRSLPVELVVAQVRVLRREIWAASTLVMLLGFGIALLPNAPAGVVLSLLAPLVAAAGVGFIYGPENDPPLEVVLATPTSPRLILLARLTVVCGYDTLLALVVSAALVGIGLSPDGIAPLVGVWLGPMLLLSAVSLWLSLWWGSVVGVGVAATLWVVRVMLSSGALRLTPTVTLQQVLELLGQTNLVTLGIAALVVAVVCVRIPGKERLEWT